MRFRLLRSLPVITVLAVASVLATGRALDGGTSRINTFNGWRVFEVITQGDNPGGDGFDYSMPGTFDGAGAWMVDDATLRVQVNHETSDASISEVDLDLTSLQTVIANVRANNNTGGVPFVLAARQAYGRFSTNGGTSFTNTSSNSTTSFSRFCSGQAYAADTFGMDRGFVDPLYITGEETSGGRLVVLDSVTRDLYQLSGVVGSAPGGTGGMPYDSWENAALLDTGETGHVALLLSPDGDTQRLTLYVGDKGLGSNGAASTSFLARNGLAYGRWFYLNGSLPGAGATNTGTFDTTSAGALSSTKLEDIDTSPSDPTRVVLGDQDSGVFVFDFDLVFTSGSFNAGASDFAVTRISTTSGGANSVNAPDNVDWTAATTLGGTAYPEGLIFVNEDNSSGEIWQMEPDGSNPVRIGETTVGSESTGIFDISAFVGFNPGSVLITNGQGSPSSMTVLISPNATLAPSVCGDGLCAADENASTCSSDCPSMCGDALCTSGETASTCNGDCPSMCGDALCTSGETAATCNGDCASMCGDSLCTSGETAGSCNGDCPSMCGDSLCTAGETAGTCNGDCVSMCGDALCTSGENAGSCNADCASMCGDGLCTMGESAGTCLGDCPTTCGDGVCAGAEGAATCLSDCPTTCGDGVCAGAEDAASCGADCTSTCGDSLCTGGEDASSCLADCPTTCGDGACAGTEDVLTCNADCASECGDGLCTAGENMTSCAADCPATCGDDQCTGDEDAATCSADCASLCGDSLCTMGETASTCAADCPAACGDGMCTGAEDATSCEADCVTGMPPGGGGGGGCAVPAVSAAAGRPAPLLLLFAVGVLLARRRTAKPRSRT